jgi:hypothetical protein
MLTGNRIQSQPVITIKEMPEKSLSRMTNDAIAMLGIDIAANYRTSDGMLNLNKP